MVLDVISLDRLGHYLGRGIRLRRTKRSPRTRRSEQISEADRMTPAGGWSRQKFTSNNFRLGLKSVS